MGFINPFSAVEAENKLQALDTILHAVHFWGPRTADLARFSDGHFDMLDFFGGAGYVGELIHSWTLLLPIKP